MFAMHFDILIPRLLQRYCAASLLLSTLRVKAKHSVSAWGSEKLVFSRAVVENFTQDGPSHG